MSPSRQRRPWLVRGEKGRQAYKREPNLMVLRGADLGGYRDPAARKRENDRLLRLVGGERLSQLKPRVRAILERMGIFPRSLPFLLNSRCTSAYCARSRKTID